METFCDKCQRQHLRPVGRRCNFQAAMESQDNTSQVAGPARQDLNPRPNQGNTSTHNASNASQSDQLSQILTEIKSLSNRMTVVEGEVRAIPHNAT